MGLVQTTFRGVFVTALAQDKPGHVPFRESKLTRLLQVGKKSAVSIYGPSADDIRRRLLLSQILNNATFTKIYSSVLQVKKES
jgi:hypothetical protein